MSPTSWVVGAGGLLGSAVVRRLEANGQFTFTASPVSWNSEEAISGLVGNIHDFAKAVGEDDWQIYWCAGVGVTGSSAEVFAEELAVFTSFLASLKEMLPRSPRRRGGLFLASSAGALYAGASGAPFHEQSAPAPLGAYGQAKLTMEAAVREFSLTTGIPSVAGRISNLYGPGQNLSKAQGLISRLCISSLTRESLSIFVSLDTIRDYIYVDDCADLAIAASDRLRASPDVDGGPAHVKVLASGRSVSIGELLGEFRRVSGSRPYIVQRASPQSSFQGRDLRLRSRFWTELDERPMVNLSDGISRTLQDIRNSFLGGRPIQK